MLNYILSDTSCTILLDGKVTTISRDKPRHWAQFIEALKSGDLPTLRTLIDRKSAITRFSSGYFAIEHGMAYYREEPIHSALTDRMIAMMEEGFDISPLVNFLDNIMENPSSSSVNELYLFLENCNLPITPDGCFLAYKRVRDTYYDVHSNTIRNQIGDKPTKPRNQVDDRRDVTCSFGLHVCSLDYLKDFSGPRLVLCKVNPRDVVSVPSDYSNHKMRVCQYEVIDELDMNTIEEFNAALPAVYDDQPIDDDDPEYYVEDEDDGYAD